MCHHISYHLEIFIGSIMILYDVNYNNICFDVLVLPFFFITCEWNSLYECIVYELYDFSILFIKKRHNTLDLDRESNNTLHCSKRGVGQLSLVCIVMRDFNIRSKNLETAKNTQVDLQGGVKHCSKRYILTCRSGCGDCKVLITFYNIFTNSLFLNLYAKYHRASVWLKRLLDATPTSIFQLSYIESFKQTK